MTHQKKFRINILFPQADDDVFFTEIKLPPVFADLGDVTEGVDVTDDLRIADKMFGQSLTMCALSQQIESSRQGQFRFFKIYRKGKIEKTLVSHRSIGGNATVRVGQNLACIDGLEEDATIRGTAIFLQTLLRTRVFRNAIDRVKMIVKRDRLPESLRHRESEKGQQAEDVSQITHHITPQLRFIVSILSK